MNFRAIGVDPHGCPVFGNGVLETPRHLRERNAQAVVRPRILGSKAQCGFVLTDSFRLPSALRQRCTERGMCLGIVRIDPQDSQVLADCLRQPAWNLRQNEG